jgi:hypothetical protein
MIIERTDILLTVQKNKICTLNGINREEFRALRIWARSEDMVITQDGDTVTIKPRKKKDLKGSVSSYVFKQLDKRAASGEHSNLDVWDMKVSYLRTTISRYNKISAVKWRVRELRPGRCVVYVDPVQPKQYETENLI